MVAMVMVIGLVMAIGGGSSAIGGRGWSRGSWSWSVVRRSSLVARFDSRSLDALRRSADPIDIKLKSGQIPAGARGPLCLLTLPYLPAYLTYFTYLPYLHVAFHEQRCKWIR